MVAIPLGQAGANRRIGLSLRKAVQKRRVVDIPPVVHVAMANFVFARQPVRFRMRFPISVFVLRLDSSVGHVGQDKVEIVGAAHVQPRKGLQAGNVGRIPVEGSGSGRHVIERRIRGIVGRSNGFRARGLPTR